MSTPADSSAPDTIVLIHGFWVTPRSWERWIPYYEAKGYRVLAPAYPGFEVEVEALNADPTPIEDLTVPAVVEHLESVVSQIEPAPMPTCARPLLTTSSVEIILATSAGLRKPLQITMWPRRTRLVSAERAFSPELPKRSPTISGVKITATNHEELRLTTPARTLIDIAPGCLDSDLRKALARADFYGEKASFPVAACIENSRWSERHWPTGVVY